MDLYDRSFDGSDRVQSGARHLAAAAARLAVSMVLSIPALPDAVWAEFQRLLTPDALWSLCLVLAGWLVATVIGGMVGLAVNGLLIAYGAVELWDELKAVAGSVKKWLTTAYDAKSERELQVAGASFAEALSAGGLTLIELIVTHRAFRAVDGRLTKALPVPEWLARRYEDARTTRSKPRVHEVARKVVSGAERLRAAGARRAAERMPTEVWAVSGALVGMAVVGGTALVLSTRRTR